MKMRKIVIRLLLVTIMPFMAQTCLSQEINIGFKAGASFSDLFTARFNGISTMPDSYPLENLTGGFTLNIKLADNWSVHSELLYEDKGVKSHDKRDSTYVGYWAKNYSTTSRDHNYFIHFPQTVRYSISFGKKKLNRVYFEGGPYFSYYLSSKYFSKWEYDNTTREQTDQDNLDEAGLSRFDWGLKIGTGIWLPMKKGAIDINFADEQMLKAFAIVVNKDYYNVFSISVGYSWVVGRIGGKF